MNNDLTIQPNWAARLLKRAGGYYILISALIIQIATNLLIVPVVAMVQFNADLSSSQFSASIWMMLLLISISNSLLLLAAFLMSRNAFHRLEQWKRQEVLPKETIEEYSAWREITSLSWRYSLVAAFSSFLLVVGPLIAYQFFSLKLDSDQMGYTLIGGIVSTFAIISTGAIGLERLLIPASEILIPVSFEAQIKYIGGLKIRGKLLALVLALIIIGVSIIGPVGYHEIVEMTRGEELDTALLEYQSQSLLMSALALIFATTLTFMVARIFSDPYRQLVAVFQKVEQGDLRQRVSVIASDESGELEIYFNHMIARLEELQNILEKQVYEQTAQLKVTNEVGSAASSILEPDELIKKVVNLITDRFGHYYSAIYLVDQTGYWAELIEATGDAGRVLKQNRHRLELNNKGLIANAINNQQATIADSKNTSIRSANPLLSYTKSEIALPLIVGDRALGALDVQSTREGAFNPQDIDTLQGMANQVAIALENAHLYQEAQKNLDEMQSIQKQYLLEAWSKIPNAEKLEYSVGDTTGEKAYRTEISLALRDQSLGTIQLTTDEDISPEERNLIDAVASQAAIALENARLVNESRQLANRERLVAEISNKIWTSTTIDGVMQTVVKELGRVLDTTRAVIELKSDENND